MRYSSFAYLTRACVSLACSAGMLITTLAQEPRPTDQQSPDRIVISKDEVPFDVVVRDKKGKMIKDLTAADFDVYEDGVKQDISSFRFVASTAAENVDKQTSTPETSTSTTIPKSSGDRTESAGVSAVALVFDRLSPESRKRAHDAALSYLGESVKKTELVGVFLTDLSVVTLQPFTYDVQRVKAGIDKAGTHATSQYTSNNEQARSLRTTVANNMMSQQLGETRPEPGTESIPAVAAMLLKSLEFYESIQRDQQGNATAHGLLHIAASLRSIPGRKAVIFFSEGLVLPPNVVDAFNSVINEANRGNVSFYSVDVAGLRTESKTAGTRQEMNSRSEMRMAQLGSSSEPTGPMTKDLERNEDLLRMNPDSGLGQLAAQTGGFLITDSNDLSGRLQKVDEDLHSYYLLSYSSSNKKYDGHFRKIEVKLKRSGLNVQSRKGYYAIKGTYGSPVLSYEAPAIAALDNPQSATSFPFLVGGFSFPDRDSIALVPLMVDVPISAFTVHVDQTKKLYDTDFSIVTLIRNHSGEVVAKLSERYQLNGPADKAENAKNERVLFYREADLPPDSYTIQAVAYDAPTGRTSVRTGTLEVPASDATRVRLSDLMILKRGEPVTNPEENKASPFRVGNLIVSPNLGEPIQRSLKQVPFFFNVYLPSVSLAKPKLTIELMSQGRTLVQMPGELPAADATGRSQFIAGLPVANIPAGSYELKVTVTAEGVSMSRSRAFTLVD